MKFALLFFVLISMFWGTIADNETIDVDSIATLVNIAIQFILRSAQFNHNFTLINEDSFQFPDNQNIIIGGFDLSKTVLYGFNSLNIVSTKAEKHAELKQTLSISVNITIGKLGIRSGYLADIGVVEKLPLYGDGELDVALSEVVTNIYLDVDLNDISKLYVRNFDLDLSFRSAPITITGFWKQDAASTLLSTAFEAIETLTVMFWNYEKQCISCVLNPLIKYTINSILKYKENSLDISSCTCLQNLFGNKYNLHENVNNTLVAWKNNNLGSILKSYSKSDVDIFLQQFVNSFELLVNSNDL